MIRKPKKAKTAAIKGLKLKLPLLLKQIREEIKEYTGVKFRVTWRGSYGNNKGEEPIDERAKISCYLEPELAPKLEEISCAIDVLLSLHRISPKKPFNVGLNWKGMSFEGLENVIELFPNKAIKLVPVVGKINIFFFWNYSENKGDYYLWANGIATFFKNHADLQEHFVIHAICVFNEESDKLVNTVKEIASAQTLIHQYWISPENWEKTPEPWRFNIIPFCLVTDRKGIILDENLYMDNLIHYLKTENTADAALKPKVISGPTLKLINQGREFIAKHQPELKAFLMNLNFEIVAKQEMDIETNVFGEATVRLVIEGEYPKEEKDKACALIEKITKECSGIMKCEANLKPVVLYSLKPGVECSKCKVQLGICDQFMCTQCSPPVYFCFKCGLSSPEEIKSMDQLVHPHALYLIQKHSIIEGKCAVRYGNIKSQVLSRTHHSVFCDCCENAPISGTRWKCAICEDSDFCPACIEQLSNPDAPERKIMLEKGHDAEKHIYIKCDFEGILTDKP